MRATRALTTATMALVLGLASACGADSTAASDSSADGQRSGEGAGSPDETQPAVLDRCLTIAEFSAATGITPSKLDRRAQQHGAIQCNYRFKTGHNVFADGVVVVTFHGTDATLVPEYWEQACASGTVERPTIPGADATVMCTTTDEFGFVRLEAQADGRWYGALISATAKGSRVVVTKASAQAGVTKLVKTVLGTR